MMESIDVYIKGSGTLGDRVRIFRNLRWTWIRMYGVWTWKVKTTEVHTNAVAKDFEKVFREMISLHLDHKDW